MITVDVSNFYHLNVADTCSVWNLLSSRIFYSAALSAKIVFCCTRFVHYECLYKPRTRLISEEEKELRKRLRHAINQGAFQAYDLSIEDLQELEVLEKRKNLGKGELSSIVFAKKTSQVFMTDDYKKARKLSQEILGNNRTQTSPHLFGWLIFTYHLGDNDKDIVIKEHKSFKRPLARQFEEIYQEALRCRLLENYPSNNL